MFSMKRFREENPNASKELRDKINMGDIKKNSVICGKCNEEVESLNRHDFRYCGCGSIAVDGGSWYLKRTGDINNYTDTSETWDD